MSLVTGDTAVLSEWPWQGTQLLVMVVALWLSGILLGCQAPSEEKNNGCDQLRLLWAAPSCVVKDQGCGVEGRKHSQQ